MLIKNLAFVSLIASISFLSGCASITGTNSQSISLQTREKSGSEVSGVNCELANNKGKWFVTTPGSVVIHRSNDDMQVLCKKENLENGRASVVSETKGSMFGNIIFGGGIGAIVDHNSGAAYEYPTVIDIVMGDFKKIEPPKKAPPQESDNNQFLQNSAPPQQLVTTAPVNTALNSQSHSNDNSPTATHDSATQKLRELQSLRRDGTITEEDFQKKKKQLLEKL